MKSRVIYDACTGKPLVTRYFLLRTKRLGIYLHKFINSDNRHLHDHPWSFISIILWGSYRETVPTTDPNIPGPVVLQTRVRRWGSIAWRPSRWTHRVELEEGKTRPISLVIRLGRHRDWGFYTQKGWQDAKSEDLEC